MTTYKESGVDTLAGGVASAKAYAHAKSTFASRKGMIGEPIIDDGGFTGMLDMGDYYLVQNDDSTGSKIDIAFQMQRYDTLGYDLLAMVCDDAVCVGAEVISVSNTLDVPKIDPEMVDRLLAGHAKACSEQKIVIAGGECAEVPGAVTHGVWSATAVGIVTKEKLLHPETIEPGDSIISLRSGVARSNGFSLIRRILSQKYGEQWYHHEWRGTTWGEIVLTPSVIYHDAVLHLLGRHGEERRVDVKGVSHITGGGIPENLERILRKSGFGAEITDPWEPHDAIKDLIELGSVPLDDAYRTWNMGNGMLLIVSPENAERSMTLLKEKGMEAKEVGKVTEEKDIIIQSYSGEKCIYSG